MNRSAVVKIEVALFLTLWFGYGVLINSRNLEAFGLQQAGVEAYVERHHLYLEGSNVPQLRVQPVVDAFSYDGHIYPAKQPGQFMFGACAYGPLYALGLTYSRDYFLTSALVTFFTASLVAAASAIAVFRTARLLASPGIFRPLMVTLAYGLGSTMLAYSGIAWHDTLATGYLAIGCYFLVSLLAAQPSLPSGAAAGFFLGLTITTSMLPFAVVLVSAAFLTVSRPRSLPVFVGGAVVGLAPLLIYNFVCFGNPLLLSNVIGNYSDTFFHPTWDNFSGKLRFYSRMISVYVPIFWFGLAGLAFFPRRLARAQLLFMTMVGALGFHILNIDANGTCQYGPRYLLPAMPIACLGLIGFSFIESPRFKRLLGFAVVTGALVSFGINVIGAMHGAMLCDFPEFAVGRYLAEMSRGEWASYPLLRWLFVPALFSAGLLIGAARRHDQVDEGAENNSALE